MVSKTTLAVALSKLKTITSPDIELEQYQTPSELAAILLHNAKLIDGLEEKHIVDFGCGNGILGIGAAMLDAKNITFLDIDKKSLHVLEQNVALTDLESEIHIIHGGLQTVHADITIMNPPFGSQKEHADKEFLKTAMRSTRIIYSIHNSGSEQFIDALCSDNDWTRTHTWNEQFMLKSTMRHHKKKREYIPVIMVRLEKQNT